MSKVLMVHTYYPVPDFPDFVGGAEHSHVVIAEGLVADYGHEVCVLRGLPPGAAPKNWIVNGVRVFGQPIRRSYWLFDGRERASWKKFFWHMFDDFGPLPKGASALVGDLDPDLLLLGNVVGLGSSLIPLARKKHVPTFQILHDYYYVCPRMTRFNNGATCEKTCFECTLTTFVRQRRLKKVDRIVAVSNFMAELIGSFTGSVEIATLYNGIPRPNAVSRHHGDNGSLRVGYLGRVSPEKGIEALIAALPDDVTLIVAGGGQEDYFRSLQKLGGGKVSFLGPVKDPFAFLGGIDLLVVPSQWHEPFGRVSIEAQMMGVPVIVANRGGLPETVREGETGLVLEPTVDAMMAAISDFRDDRGKLVRFGSAAKIWSREFAQEQMLQRVNDSIQEILGK